MTAATPRAEQSQRIAVAREAQNVANALWVAAMRLHNPTDMRQIGRAHV